MISKQKNIEFGIVVALVLAIFSLGWKLDLTRFILLVLLMALVLPKVFIPFTWAWHHLAECLNRVMTALLLLLVFYLIVTPVGVIRRFLGDDTMRLRQFKKAENSVFDQYSKTYKSSDMEKQY
ncbi:MAG: hypothetical protein ACK5JD_09925 [Mangrovibacterium sp.]